MIRVIAEECIGQYCCLCVAACPSGAISILEDVANIDRKKCVECKECIKECPNWALVFYEEGANEVI